MSSIVVRVGGYAVSAPLEQPIADATTELARRDAVFVFVQTDDGIVGWGEAVTYGMRPTSMLNFVLAELGPSVLGSRPEDVIHTTHQLRLQSRQHDGGGIATIGRGAIDCALWDAAARRLAVPLRNLLGSDSENIDAYASLGFYCAHAHAEEDKTLEDEVARALARGYRSFKIKIGRRDLAADLKRATLVRELGGESALIAVDANRAYGRHDAFAAAKALADLEIAWLEEPFPLNDEESYQWLCSRSPVAIAAGENAFTLERLSRLVELGVTVIQPDVSWTGGITPVVGAAKLAEVHGCLFAPHSFSSSLNALTAAQVVAATTSRAILELDCTGNPLMSELTDIDWSCALNEQGQFALPTEAGCGWTPNIPRELVVFEDAIGLPANVAVPDGESLVETEITA